jgi:hypothetical protein
MPGAPPTSPAPFRVADTLELPSVECVTPATATWTFGRRPDEVAGTCVWFELAPED